MASQPPSDLLSEVTLSPQAQFALHATHALFSFIIVALQLSGVTSPALRVKATGVIENGALKQFARGWLCLWIGWVVMYAWLASRSLLAMRTIEISLPIAQTITDVMMCVNAAILFACFLSLDSDSVNLPDQPRRNTPFVHGMISFSLLGLGVVSISAADRFQFINLHGAGVILVGLYAGLGMIFFVAPFCSLWMGAPRLFLFPLYAYALIQVTYSLFHLNTQAQTIMYGVVMFMKLTLFFVVTYLSDDEHMGRYLLEARKWKQAAFSRQYHSIARPIHDNHFNDLLDTAKEHLNKQQIDVAGVMAGKALEGHLRRFCHAHDIEYRSKDTLKQLVNRMKAQLNVSEPQEKRLLFLISIRNGCTHEEDENGRVNPHPPSAEDVQDMIESVRKMIAHSDIS